MMMSQEKLFKLNRSFLSYHTKGFVDKVSSELKAQVKTFSRPNFSTKTVPNDDVNSG